MDIPFNFYDKLIDSASQKIQSLYKNTLIDKMFYDFNLSYTEVLKRIFCNDRQICRYIDFDANFENVRLLEELENELFLQFEEIAFNEIESVWNEAEFYYLQRPESL